MKKVQYILTLLLVLTSIGVGAQTIPVTPFSFDEDLRVLQLNNKLSPKWSFTNRPFNFQKGFNADSLYRLLNGQKEQPFKERKLSFWDDKIILSVLPITSLTKYTSNQPYGWSDGSLMPINGIQQVLTGGLFLKLGPISAQVKPEFLATQSRPFEISDAYGPNNVTPSGKKYFNGQSKIALTVGPFSAGLSTENIWWGPGQFSSLIMSNNAPGFFHVTFNTVRPFRTPIGSFEFQVIGGLPKDSRDQSDEIYNLRNFYQVWGKNPENPIVKKYFNGINLNYTPKFFDDLTLGFTRAFISGSGSTIFDVAKNYGYVEAFLPIINGIFKEKRILFEDSLKWNQLASVYGRLRFPKAKAELYFEYGWNDYTYNLRDFILSTNHSSAFIVGAKKVIELRQNKIIDLSIELNQMSQPINSLVRNAGSWYMHWFQSNYSNFGETLGSGIGRGSNSLIFAANFRKGLNKIGLIFEKVNRDPVGAVVKWNDYSLGITSRLQYKSLLFNLRVSPIISNNYGWIEGKSKSTLMSILGVSYFF